MKSLRLQICLEKVNCVITKNVSAVCPRVDNMIRVLDNDKKDTFCKLRSFKCTYIYAYIEMSLKRIHQELVSREH